MSITSFNSPRTFSKYYWNSFNIPYSKYIIIIFPRYLPTMCGPLTNNQPTKHGYTTEQLHTSQNIVCQNIYTHKDAHSPTYTSYIHSPLTQSLPNTLPQKKKNQFFFLFFLYGYHSNRALLLFACVLRARLCHHGRGS